MMKREMKEEMRMKGIEKKRSNKSKERRIV
jgi:hypothetical protein